MNPWTFDGKQVKFFHAHPITIAYVIYGGNVEYAATACHVNDVYDKQKGRLISFGRLVKGGWSEKYQKNRRGNFIFADAGEKDLKERDHKLFYAIVEKLSY